MVVVVDIAGIGRRTMIEPAELMTGCDKGDRVLVLGYKIVAGGTDWRLPLNGCQRLPPDSPGR